ncbi:hypothetical protein [Streptomyces sp. P9-A4]|uniref:hypothetical protein n=1 Tax=Streptomyces sp. P9-A4 TaxID=3072285 RepID=UPI002FC73CCB
MTTRRRLLGGAAATGAMAALGGAPAAAAAAAEAVGGGAPAAAAVGRSGAREAIVAVNDGTRAHYAALKSDLIGRLSPVLVVQNDAKGGRFTLIHDGSRESLHPVAEVFELAKSVSHVPLGVFAIVAPHLGDRVPHLPNGCRIDPHDLAMVASGGTAADGWIASLQEYAGTLTAARRRLDEAGLPPEMAGASARVLDGALRFIAESLASGSVDIAAFEDFSGSVYEGIRTNMAYAAEAQIAGVEGVMRRWRAEIGEEAWRNLYTVVLSQWATSVLNQNSIIIRRCMNPAEVATHLIDLPAAEPPADPVFVALDNLARIVQDNIAAELVFPSDPAAADALKGPQDLLADEILRRLGASTADGTAYSAPAGAGDACPVARRDGTRG